jgi:hypothetical protein
MSKEMREQINKVNNWKQFLNESCEGGGCVPSYSHPEGKWKKQKQEVNDAYADFIRKGGEMDGGLFDELYDDMSNKAFFKFEKQNIWYNEDNHELNKNEMEILKPFPVIDSFNSWKEWVNSIWFNTTHLTFSNKALKNPIFMYTADGKIKKLPIGEEPFKNKKMYFEMYNDKFGPLLVKKISSHTPK